MREANRPHLQAKAQQVLQALARTLRHAGISAKARVQMSPQGRGRIVVYTQHWGSLEASLLLPSRMGGFEIKVV